MSVAVVAFVVCNSAAAMAAVNDVVAVVVVANVVVVISGRGLCCCCCFCGISGSCCCCCGVCFLVVVVCAVSFATVCVADCVAVVLSYGLCRLVFLNDFFTNFKFAFSSSGFRFIASSSFGFGIAVVGLFNRFNDVVVVAVLTAACFIISVSSISFVVGVGMFVTFARDVKIRFDVLLVVGFIVVFVDITNIFLFKNFLKFFL